MDYLLLGDNGELGCLRAHLPAIHHHAVSHQEQEVELTRCLELGADAYRLKPIRADGVREILLYVREKREFLGNGGGGASRPDLGALEHSISTAPRHCRSRAASLGSRAAQRRPPRPRAPC